MITALAARDLPVSLAQLERWRRAGLLPRHVRTWLGRGRGSVAVLDPATVEIAATLATYSRQGRNLRWAVLHWYMKAGQPVLGGGEAIPEPPFDAVHDARVWAVRSSPMQIYLEQARAARTEEAQDAYYAAAERAFARRPLTGPAHPELVRAALESGKEIPDGSNLPGGRTMAHLFAAAGMGYEEVGASLLGEAMAAFYPQIPAAQWAPVLEDMEQCGELAALMRPLAQHDPLELAQRTDAGQLAEARTTTLIMAGFGAMYQMHAWFMPDTPALAALRARIDSLGVATATTTLIGSLLRLPLAPSGRAVRRHAGRHHLRRHRRAGR